MTRAMAAAVVMVGVLVGGLASPAWAPPASTCTITPVLRDVTVNQGVGSYARLTRGKDAIVRAYLSLPQTLPSCAGSGAYAQITGGSVTVTGGTSTTVGPTPAPSSPFAQVASFASAPASDAPADLKFVVPGSAFESANPAAFPVTITVTINYQSAGTKSGTLTSSLSTTFTTKSGSTTPITATVGQPSNNLRVLVVPVGNRSDTSGAQFPSSAVTSVQNGMATVSRVMPVRQGIGDLATAGNGLRYRLLPDASMIDVGPAGLNLMSGGRFCIEPLTHWGPVSSALATTLQNWNALNPSQPADRAVGVVWQDVSSGAEANCYEGIADVNGGQAMVRVYSDAQSTSDTGALLAHELLHTFGGSHSINSTADRDAPLRAYNVTTRQFLDVNRSVMTTNFDASYLNTTTLFESGAYALAQCALTPGATAGCSNPGTVGVAGAGGPALVLAGSTCGTSASCTRIVSYLDGDFQPRTTASPGSEFTVVQLNGNTPVGTPVPVPVSCTQENERTAAPQSAPTCAVQLAVTKEAGSNRVQLRKGSTVLYDAVDDGQAPRIDATRPLTAPSLANWTAVSGDDIQPALCGNLLAWVDGSGIRVRRVDKSAPASAAGAFPGSEPAWTSNCSTIVYRGEAGNSRGDVEARAVNVGAGAPTFGAASPIYQSDLLNTRIGSVEARHPTVLANDSSIVVELVGRGLWRVDTGGLLGASGPVCTNLNILDLLASCTQIVNNPASHNPSAGPGDVVAFENATNGSIQQIALSDGTLTTPIAAGTNPDFGGTTLVYDGPGGIWTREANGVQTQLTVGNDTWPTIDGSASTVALDRLTSGQHDIWVSTLTRTGTAFTVTDNNIANVHAFAMVRCPDGSVVPLGEVQLVSVSGTTATYLIPQNPDDVCAGGTLMIFATDGWNTTSADNGPIGFAHDPVAAIYTIAENEHLLQFDSWHFTGGGVDDDEPSSGLVLTWRITGPSGFTPLNLSGPAPADIQPPTNGFPVGEYTETLTVGDSTGRTGTMQRRFFVDPDADHDGIPAGLDTFCDGTTADNDPSNANLDSDGDGTPNREDPEICSPPNVGVTITPSTVNVGNDTGNPINLTLTSSVMDFTTVAQSTVRLTTIGGIVLNAPIFAYQWSASSSSASAKFDRATVDAFLRANNLIGPSITFTVTGSNGTTTFLGSGATATCSGGGCPRT